MRRRRCARVKTNSLPRCDPARQGVEAAAIAAFLDAIKREKLELHSLMVVRGGCVVAEGWWAPYRRTYPHLLNSLSKSFTSTAIGIAVHEGRLSIEDCVLSFFPEYGNETIRANMAELKVRHLLTMSTGQSEDTIPALWQIDSDWVRAFLEMPITHAPGTRFLYNTGATYMLSAILERATGEKLLDYLRPRLFDPLGIEEVTTAACPDGIHAGGYGMNMTTESIAMFGLLYLQGGVWNGRQIVPEAWVREATKAHIRNAVHQPDSGLDWEQGYGYQFWRCRHGAYRGDGAFGQFCIVIPQSDAVIAMTAGEYNMQAVLDQVWEHLLPGLTELDELPSSPAGSELAEKLDALTHLPEGRFGGAPPEWERKEAVYALEPNEAGYDRLGFSSDGTEVRLRFVGEDGEQVLSAGLGSFREGRLTLAGFDFRYGAYAYWLEPAILEVTLFMTENPFRDTIVCQFDGDRIRLTSRRNVPIVPVLSDAGVLPLVAGIRTGNEEVNIHGDRKGENLA